MPSVYLIHGAAGTGKTAVAQELAAASSIDCLAVDDLYLSLQSQTTAYTHPALHHFLNGPVDVSIGVDEMLALLIEAAEAVSETLAGLLHHELRLGRSLIVEGAWMLPSLTLRFDPATVQAVVIHEPEPEAVLAAMLTPGREALPEQRVLAGLGSRFGNRLRAEALAFGVPVVEARPRESLTQRSGRALGLPL